MSPLQQIDFRDIERVSVSKKSVYTHDEKVTNFMGSPFTLRIRTVEHSDNGGIYKLRTRYTLGEGLEIWGQSIVTYFPQTNRVETDLETRMASVVRTRISSWPPQSKPSLPPTLRRTQTA